MKVSTLNYFRLRACLAFLLLALCGKAQLPSYYHFRNFNLKNNFPARQVNCITEDSSGLIWIGTHSGLLRFDGNSFHSYKHDPETAKSLGSDYVTALHCDARGLLWIGTSSSLSLYIPEEDSFFHLNLSSISTELTSSHWVTRILSDSHKHIWVSFQSGILIKIIPEKLRFERVNFTINSNLLKGGIWDFDFINDSVLAIIGKYDFHVFETGALNCRTFTIINREIDKGPFLLLNVMPDPENDSIFWFGTWGLGLIKFDLNSGSIEQLNYESGLPANISNIVFDLIPDAGNNILIAGRAPYKFDKAEQVFQVMRRYIEISDQKASPEIRCIFRDSGKRIWLGTADGLSLFNPEKPGFVYHALPDKSGSNIIAVNRKANRIYLANIYSSRSFRVYDTLLNPIRRFSLPGADEVFSEPVGISVATNGDAFIGTFRTGFWKYDNAAVQLNEIKLDNSQTGSSNCIELHWLVPDSILCLRNAENELIFWDCISEKVIHKIKIDAACSAFYITGKDQLSALTESGQLIKIGPDLRIRKLSIKGIPKFNVSQINGMAEDSSGDILFSAESSGIFKLSEISPGKCLAIKLNQPWNFPFYNLSSLFIDAQGMIWCSDQFNLFRINPADNSWIRFNTELGNIVDVSGVQFIQYQLNEIWISAFDGFLSFNTKQLEHSTEVPRPILSSLIVNGKKRNGFLGSDIQTIQLQYDENSVSMSFPALEWNSPSEINYAYQLEGLDKNLHKAGNNYIASYVDIPPGNYAFHVIVTSAEGISKDFELIRIRILPAWWQTSFFRLFLITIALLSIFFSGRYIALAQIKRKLRKLEQDQKIHQVRNRIARDIHDEIGSGLTKINLLSRQLESSGNSDTEKNSMIQKISSQSRSLIQNIAEIIWSVNPENDSVASTVSYMRDYIGKFFDNTSIDYLTEVIVAPGIPPDTRINPEIKRNLIMIFKELLNNSLRHSKCTSVFFLVRFDETRCSLTIADNGIGPGAIHDGKRGNGVRNIMKRLEEMQGKIEYSGNSGTTATCTFTWKLNSY